MERQKECGGQYIPHARINPEFQHKQPEETEYYSIVGQQAQTTFEALVRPLPSMAILVFLAFFAQLGPLGQMLDFGCMGS